MSVLRRIDEIKLSMWARFPEIANKATIRQSVVTSNYEGEVSRSDITNTEITYIEGSRVRSEFTRSVAQDDVRDIHIRAKDLTTQLTRDDLIIIGDQQFCIISIRQNVLRATYLVRIQASL